MKRTLFGLLLMATVFAQVPGIVLVSFDWPDPVSRGMALEVVNSGQTIVLTYDRLMKQSYDTRNQQIHRNILLSKGTEVTVWRFDYNNQKYLLISNGHIWHWTLLPKINTVVNKSNVSSRELTQPNKLQVKFQGSYWDGIYDDTMVGFRVSGFIIKPYSWQTKLGEFNVNPGMGLTIRSKPGIGNSERLTIPMLRFQLSGEWKTNVVNNYIVGRYFAPFADKYETTREVYYKLSSRLPAPVNNFRVNFVYFGNQPTTKEWLYCEGKIQFVYLYNWWWIGVEPYVSGRWENNSGWVSQNKAHPGNLVVGAWKNSNWFELSLGRYFKESGKKPYYEHAGLESHISFSVGTKLRR